MLKYTKKKSEKLWQNKIFKLKRAEQFIVPFFLRLKKFVKNFLIIPDMLNLNKLFEKGQC